MISSSSARRPCSRRSTNRPIRSETREFQLSALLPRASAPEISCSASSKRPFISASSIRVEATCQRWPGWRSSSASRASSSTPTSTPAGSATPTPSGGDARSPCSPAPCCRAPWRGRQAPPTWRWPGCPAPPSPRGTRRARAPASPDRRVRRAIASASSASLTRRSRSGSSRMAAASRASSITRSRAVAFAHRPQRTLEERDEGGVAARPRPRRTSRHRRGRLARAGRTGRSSRREPRRAGGSPSLATLAGAAQRLAERHQELAAPLVVRGHPLEQVEGVGVVPRGLLERELCCAAVAGAGTRSGSPSRPRCFQRRGNGGPAPPGAARDFARRGPRALRRSRDAAAAAGWAEGRHRCCRASGHARTACAPGCPALRPRGVRPPPLRGTRRARPAGARSPAPVPRGRTHARAPTPA